MHLDRYCAKPSYANDNTVVQALPCTMLSTGTKSMATCVIQSHHMPGRTKQISLHMLPNQPYASEDANCISICLEKTPHRPTVTQNVSEDMLTKHMYGPVRTESPSNPVFTKTLPYQRGRKMYLNSCCPSIRTYHLNIFGQTPPMTGRT